VKRHQVTPNASTIQLNRGANIMTTTTKNIHRAIVSLKLPHKVTDLVTHALAILKGLAGNPAYPDPVPTLPAITAAVEALQASQTAALTRARGTATVRNEKREALMKLLVQLKAYIQAQADTNVENGASIIESAGVGVRKVAASRPRVFAAKAGALSGTVQLVAPTARRGSYEWEYSTDGGKTWIAMPPTLQSATSLSGLQAGTTVQFRYRSVTKIGASDWSPSVSLMVR
jgi:hypothetical protein